jgi:hypothetical protein
VHVHGALFNEDMIAPDLVEQLRTAVHARGASSDS